MRYIQRSVIGLAAGLCIVGAGLSACGATADSGATTTAPTSGTAVASTASGSSTSSTSSTSSASGSGSVASGPTGTVSAAPSPSSGSGPVVPTSTSTRTSPIGSTPVRTPGRQLTLTGTVQEGAEARCLVLKDEKTGLQVNLAGGNTAVQVGVRVTVVGQIRTDLMSYCQQGPIFVVSSATAG
jgi:hypothetical protein